MRQGDVVRLAFIAGLVVIAVGAMILAAYQFDSGIEKGGSLAVAAACVGVLATIANKVEKNA